mmetsp:Transcript_56026/g.110957  ORF Transcript_56026/g.110957 Transcript_56026/m.110957 type:complete len:222 (-) Transcript_56026:136-801(-)
MPSQSTPRSHFSSRTAAVPAPPTAAAAAAAALPLPLKLPCANASGEPRRLVGSRFKICLIHPAAASSKRPFGRESFFDTMLFMMAFRRLRTICSFVMSPSSSSPCPWSSPWFVGSPLSDEVASKGVRPHRSSKATIPSVHQSTAWWWPVPKTSSGAKYSAVPHSVNDFSPGLITLANPKSMSFAYPLRPTITFSGFKSRNTKFLECTWPRPSTRLATKKRA